MQNYQKSSKYSVSVSEMNWFCQLRISASALCTHSFYMLRINARPMVNFPAKERCHIFELACVPGYIWRCSGEWSAI